MIPTLPQDKRSEIDALAIRYGRPLVRTVDLAPNTYLNTENLGVRASEVCMVVRRIGGRLLTFRKTFYPQGVFRLLTGGIAQDESVLDALRRECQEETGLQTELRRLLAIVSYGVEGSDDPPIFHTFAFLLDEISGMLGALDAAERVEAFRDIEPPELLTIAARLDDLDAGYAEELNSRWRDWGRFRAVIHRIVSEAL